MGLPSCMLPSPSTRPEIGTVLQKRISTPLTGAISVHVGNRKKQEMAITPTSVDIALKQRKSSGA